MKIKTRLYLDPKSETALAVGQKIVLPPDPAHAVKNVLRGQVGDGLCVFDGISGSFLAVVSEITKKNVVIDIQEYISPLKPLSSLTVYCALIKKTPFEWMIQKLTELGVGHIQPMITDYTVIKDMNQKRIQEISVQATEQCGGNSITHIDEPISFASVIATRKNLIFADERLTAIPLFEYLISMPKPKIDGILIGPEGGFSPNERMMLEQQDFIIPVGLGNHILRAETAAMMGAGMVIAGA